MYQSFIYFVYIWSTETWTLSLPLPYQLWAYGMIVFFANMTQYCWDSFADHVIFIVIMLSVIVLWEIGSENSDRAHKHIQWYEKRVALNHDWWTHSNKQMSMTNNISWFQNFQMISTKLWVHVIITTYRLHFNKFCVRWIPFTKLKDGHSLHQKIPRLLKWKIIATVFWDCKRIFIKTLTGLNSSDHSILRSLLWLLNKLQRSI